MTTIRTELEDRVLRVTPARPERMNAINGVVRKELTAACSADAVALARNILPASSSRPSSGTRPAQNQWYGSAL
ncbi:hypothetical protein [Frankia gtarii]|uniref:hypothetical protein n=1 Tax=Frankia gtarii TaxID=2950102 RepID=UPI0021C0899B|nr:hypothetical protein [Frankia gtarii]